MVYSLFIYAMMKLYLILNIFQQAHYQFRFYRKHFFLNFCYYDLFPISILIIEQCILSPVVFWICSAYLIAFSFLYLFRRKALVFTKRMIRLFFLSTLYLIGVSLIPYVNLYLLLFSEWTILPLFWLEQRISSVCNRPYLKKAQEKLKRYPGHIIAITGSFGKTSTKLLMRQALECFTPTTATTRSYNTPLGISKFINEIHLEAYSELVLEFGASKVGDIDQLLRLVQPDVAMVCEIGYMHVETFGSLENIIREKMSLVDRLKKGGIAVLNYDCKYIREYPVSSEIRLITYGLEYGTYQAKNIQIGKISSFDLIRNGKNLGKVQVRLVGKHQILNLVGVLGYCYEMGYSLEVLKRAALSFHSEANRLEMKKFEKRIVLDDSFNSNYKGFIEALNVLSTTEGTKILLTPGMVELGKYQKELMEGLISSMVRNCDVVILIGYQPTKNLYQKLKEYALEVYLVRNFMEGYRLYLSIAKSKKQSSLLIENDLPDLYRVGFYC